jgi:GTP-binding protein EngB required for normal cell division
MSSLNFTFSPEALAQAEAATTNPYLADPTRGLELVTRLITHSAAALAVGQRANLARLHQLIHERFFSLAARDDHPGAVLAHRKLLALEASLQDLVSFPDLANKSIIGVGGGFSAGKSRFLNTLLGQPLLPEDTTPTTAIPTFLTHGAAPSTVALNTFNHQVPLDAPALAAITHAFRKHYLQTAGQEVGFAHVLKLLMLRTPVFSWTNLAFLDTPGYSKADGEGTHTDERLALQQLAEADHLVWLINAKNGSIREDDVTFLRTLKHPEPVFVVLTQADLIGQSSMDAVMTSTREALGHAGIACAGLMAWAAPLHATQGERVAGEDVLAWLTGLDQTPKFTTKRNDCAQVLDAYIHHSGNALKHNLALLAALNELLPLTNELPSNRQQALRDQVERGRNEQKRLRELVGEFEALKRELLMEVGAIVGEVAVDQEVRNDRRLLHTLTTKVLRGPVAVGTQFTATVKVVNSAIKRVILTAQEGGSLEFHLSFSKIRDCLQLDPLTLVQGSVLAVEVFAADANEITLSITNPHALD